MTLTGRTQTHRGGREVAPIAAGQPPSRAEPSQADAVALMSDAATHGGVPVVRIDTAISHIFIAGPTTYKMKRAVQRNFVDYSTLCKRQALCEREVAVNTAYAPALYKGVVSIVSRTGRLHLGGAGEPVESLVEMTTFDPEKAFDRLAEAGKLTDIHVRELADVIAAMHTAAPVALRYGGADAVAQTIRQISGAIASTAVAESLQDELRAWQTAADFTHSSHARRIETRRRHGYVRRCHGDLHLGNICLFEDRPTPFDAIEFSEEIASTDILYDLAFALMDLLHRGLRDQANLLMSRYINITRDTSGLALMPLFVSLRAAVRAMVAASSANPDIGADEARSRLALAARVLAPAPPPTLIAIGGLSGSGKSTLARNLAARVPGLFGALTIRSDVCRKRLLGVAPETPLPGSAYTPEVSARVYRVMQRDAMRALRSGTSVILDATFIDGDKTADLERLATNAGARFAGLWLTLDLGTLQERIGARGPDASDATPAVALAQWQSVHRNPAWTEIDAGRPEHDVAAAAGRVLGLTPA